MGIMLQIGELRILEALRCCPFGVSDIKAGVITWDSCTLELYRYSLISPGGIKRRKFIWDVKRKL